MALQNRLSYKNGLFPRISTFIFYKIVIFLADFVPTWEKIEIRQNKYLNNIIEQDHRFIKKQTKSMLGFKSFRSAKITIAGIENIRIIQKGQITGSNNNASTFENFKMLMAS